MFLLHLVAVSITGTCTVMWFVTGCDVLLVVTVVANAYHVDCYMP